ncbi:MAG: uroporphyrinogen decarboxylase family protein [Phycisphaerae bacterium]
MTPRERWLALLNKEKPDRIPTDYHGTWEVTQRLVRELSCADEQELFENLHIDVPTVLDAGRTVPTRDTETDIWGIRYAKVDYGVGVYEEAVCHPLADATTVKEIHAYPWPRADECNYDNFKKDVERVSDYRIIRAGNYEPFLIYCLLRGYVRAMTDLIEEPEIADAILGHLFDYHYERNARMFEIGKGRIDITQIAEDLGSQEGLLMGLDHIRRYILPNQKKMADLARSYGVHIFYHTDGAARAVIPDLIHVTGIEILDPVQWRCSGMDREGLVRDFGDKLIFHGSIDNQHTLPFGSAQEVRQEVLDSINIYRDARWICGPCHNLQPNTSTENILALYHTIYEFGKL